jgi:Flp pilus assembly pilin Flp
MGVLRKFAACSRGQDLLEYVLLLALIIIATTAAMVTAGESLSAVWNAPVLGTTPPASSTDLQSH